MPATSLLVTSDSWQHIGVDWDSGGWVAVGYSENGEPGVALYEDFGSFWEEHGETADCVVVDIPIGLCGPNGDADAPEEHDGPRSRYCDSLARRVIGPRSSSVFPAPCRAAVEAWSEDASYSDLNRINKANLDKGLTQQAASIIPGIQQVESVLANGASDETIVEGHPEVCFRAFTDKDLQYHKATAQGTATRLKAMAESTEYVSGTWLALANDLGSDEAVGLDDLLDALGLALTARADRGEFHSLPNADSIPTDDEGRPMRMVYRREEPFNVN